MRKTDKLARRGWWKAMISQGTLSLILTLDDFLMSGPHLITEVNELSLLDPNIFFVSNSMAHSVNFQDYKCESKYKVSTYYVLRPYIRGILYGLNPLYQISLYVPCRDPLKKELYKEIISKIDIGGQFFQDRIYWTFEALESDIMDTRLACLIHAGSLGLNNEWIRKISIESKPFSATYDVDFTTSDNLFDLVEMRSFLEDVHQRYFSLLNESKKFYFADIIRMHVDEKSRRSSGDSNITNTSGFYSATTGPQNNNNMKPFSSDKYVLKHKDNKIKKKDSQIFATIDRAPSLLRPSDSAMLLEEYQDIIEEQLELNHSITHISTAQSSFAKTLCRWNKITQRKSDILRMLMNQDDKDYVHKRLKELNSVYCMRKCQSENDLLASVRSNKSSLSAGSNSSEYLVISNKLDADNNNNNSSIVKFTTWYIKDLKL